MECHGDRLPGRKTNTEVPSVEEGLDVERISVARSDEDTMSTMAKLAKEIDEFRDISQPTAACQVVVCPSSRTQVTKRPAPTRAGRSRRHRGACLRYGVTDDIFPRQIMESNALLFSLGQPVAGFLVKSMRLIPTNMVGQTCERVGDCGSHAKRVVTKRRKTVTLNEEEGEVFRGEGHDADCGADRRRQEYDVSS